MRYYFPRTMKAAEATERSQWAIGDALLIETDDKHVGPRGMNAVVKEMEANGVGFSAKYLGALRRCAETFKPARRHALPWKVHEAAGNPDTLDVIVRSAKKTGDKVTIWYVAKALKVIRDEARAERQKARADAVAEAEEAKAEERKARERERKLKEEKASAAERAQAERQRVAATKHTHEKVAKAKNATRTPRPRDMTAPAEDDVPLMVLTTTLAGNMSEALHLVAKTEKAATEYADSLTPKMVAYLIEEAMSLANAATRLAALLRKAAPKGSHLSVVNE